MKLVFLMLSIFVPPLLYGQKNTLEERIGLTIDLPLKNSTHFYEYAAQEEGFKSSYLGIGFYAYYKCGKNKFSIGYEVPVVTRIVSGGGSTLALHIIEGLANHPIVSIANRIKLNGILGPNVVKYNYSYYADTGNSYDDFKKKYQTIGVTVGVELEPVRFFAIALLYRPVLIDYGHKSYKDILSFTAKFNINVWKHTKIIDKKNEF